jgi:tetratricopeptide (TPR) repeat protein
MKQKHRHQLKENELAHTVAAAREFTAQRSRSIAIIATVVIAIAVIVLGVAIVRYRASSQANAALAAAMVVLDSPVQPPTPAEPPAAGKPGTMEAQAPGTFPTEEAKLKAALPKLKEAADAHPDTDAGVTARYHLAATYAALGNHKEAIAAYDAVIARGGDSIYERMAKLGKATEQVRLGEFQPAIETYKALAEDKSTEVPADAVLIQLARAYEASGNKDEARKTFSRIVHEHPGSPYSAEAGKQIQQ